MQMTNKMRMSQLFTTTLRETPNDSDVASYQLLYRAGYIRQLGAGIINMLPLGLRVARKIEQIIREEMDALGGQELILPMVHPAEIWKKSGRWDDVDAELLRFKDRSERDYCLGMTHEEIMGGLAAQFTNSYKQLPYMLYQFQNKFRDEPRARAGLIRAREFVMKDAYSFHADAEDFDVFYKQMYDAYMRIFERSGLEVIAVESDTGLMGGEQAHEFMYLTPIGEDTLLISESGDYLANRQVATFKKDYYPEDEKELEVVETPDTTTINALAEFLNIPTSKTAKAVFLKDEKADDDKLIFAVVRGDMDLNENKLASKLNAKALRPATVEEIHAVGAEPGYGSPIGIKREQVTVIIDDAVEKSGNLVAGANRVGYHYLNTNAGRDYEADLVADITAAKQGDKSVTDGSALREERGVEVGNIFNLGTKYADSFDATFLNQEGKKTPIQMGCYGIGVGRLMAVLVEAFHDDFGIKWPKQVAPFDVSIILLKDKKSEEPTQLAEKLYEDLAARDIEVLFDDRTENPGVKFKDADLIGTPLHVTIGSRGLAKGIAEVKNRMTGEKQEVSIGEIKDFVTDWVKS